MNSLLELFEVNFHGCHLRAGLFTLDCNTSCWEETQSSVLIVEHDATYEEAIQVLQDMKNDQYWAATKSDGFHLETSFIARK